MLRRWLRRWPTTRRYLEGTSYNDSWEKQTSFVKNDLTGYVNWIVYDKDSFPSDYEHSDNQYIGYQPTPGEYTYVYQVFSTGVDELHGFTVTLDVHTGLADNIGVFGPTVTPNVVPDGMVLNSNESAFWEFGLVQGYVPVSQGLNSQMLAFCSSYSPEQLFGDAADGGNDATVTPLPSPGMINITVPEPSTLCLTLVGLGTWAAAWAAQRRQGRKGL